MEYAYIKDKSDPLFKDRDDLYLGAGVLVIE